VTETAITRLEPNAPNSGFPPSTLPAITALFESLAAAGISYCVWKSNEHLAVALTGATDLDLMVERTQASTFRAVVSQHGLRALVAPPDACHPATEHFLGFDPATGRTFHLHVQYQVVLGQRYIKNYTLPIERQLFAFVEHLHGVAVPSPELELAVLATRALLKYRLRDAVKDVLRIRSPGVPAATRAEVTWLEDRATIAKLRDALDMNGNVIPTVPVCDFLERLAAAPRSGFAFLRLRSKARRALRRFRRRGSSAAWTAYVRAGWHRRRRLRRHPPDLRLTLSNGGTTIAFVGADGSGKSTIADSLADWLGSKLQTRVHYMGSKQPSHRSRVLYVVYRMLRRSHRALRSRRDVRAASLRLVAQARDATLALHQFSIGRDRAVRYQHALADAAAGRVVLFDRFPLASLSVRNDHRLFDGPQIASGPGERAGWLVREIAAAEARIYEQFGLPNCLVVLTVEPDVAASRKPDHAHDVLVRKCNAIRELAQLAECRGDTVVIRIDANQPVDAVLADLEPQVWRAL
jgi:thymidylate kinase